MQARNWPHAASGAIFEAIILCERCAPMKLKDKVVVVTGGASGIGRALCERFAREGARGIVVADLDQAATGHAAQAVGGLAVPTDVASQADVQRLVDTATGHYGQVDLFCSNAGILVRKGEEATDAEWLRMWDVNLMGHVHAARAVLPQMLARGEGYLLQTASAAGLLSQLDSAPYSVTKHAAVAFAEWLSITYGERGIRVSCLCPQGVRTPMMMGEHGDRQGMLTAGSVSPDEVAQAVVDGLDAERFLILPHPEVLEYYRRKASDYDRWLAGMRRLRKRAEAEFGLGV